MTDNISSAPLDENRNSTFIDQNRNGAPPDEDFSEIQPPRR